MKEKYIHFKSNLGITSFVLFLIGFGMFVFGELSYGFYHGGFEIIGTIIIMVIGSILFVIILALFLTSIKSIIPYILLTLPFLGVCIFRLVDFGDVSSAVGLISAGVLLITFLVIFPLSTRKILDTELDEEETVSQPVQPITSFQLKAISTDMLIQIIFLALMLIILLVVWFIIPISPLQLMAAFLYLSGHLLSLRYLNDSYNWNFNLISSILSVIFFASLSPDLLIYASGVYYIVGVAGLVIVNSIILVYSFQKTVKEKKADSVVETDTEKILET